MSRTISFDQHGDFAATRAAEAWCKENGYSVGRMQAREPRGILKGNYDIAKWRNLTLKERQQLDGTMRSDGRNGPVYITIKDGA